MGHDFQVERGESFGEWLHKEMLCCLCLLGERVSAGRKGQSLQTCRKR